MDTIMSITNDSSTDFIYNDDLETILDNWMGTPYSSKGHFRNLEKGRNIGFKDVLKWQLTKNPDKKEKRLENYEVPIVYTDHFLQHDGDTIAWLGHSSFFVRINGKTLLIDPVFDKIPATKRWSKMPCTIDKFVNIDYILVSHSHYDHCDKSTLKKLFKLNPGARVLTGLRLDELLMKWSQGNDVQAAGWYQKYNTDKDIEIVYLPTKHRSNRSLNDVNKTLWGAFLIRAGGKTIYFGGDSGYGGHYTDVGKLFPNIDVAMIAIGAYSPRWFMSPNHHDPELAARAFNDTKARLMIPMHYGTFDLADEPRGEPQRLLKSLVERGEVHNDVAFPAIGEEIVL